MKNQLRYKIRLERMGNERYAKKVYNEIGKGGKWVQSCGRNVKKCGLKKNWVVNRMGEVNGWRMDNANRSSGNISETKWKGMVGKEIEKYGLEKWKNGMIGKTSLVRYQEKQVPRREIFYDGSLGSSLLFKARTESVELNARTYRWQENYDKCKLFVRKPKEDVTHWIVECEFYDDERTRFIRKIVGIIGEERWEEIRMKDDLGLGYILGIESSVPIGVIEETKLYLEQLWYKRKNNIGE